MLALTFPSAPFSSTRLPFPLCNIPSTACLCLCAPSVLLFKLLHIFRWAGNHQTFYWHPISKNKTLRLYHAICFCGQFREAVSLDTRDPDTCVALPWPATAIPSGPPSCISSLRLPTSAELGFDAVPLWKGSAASLALPYRTDLSSASRKDFILLTAPPLPKYPRPSFTC